MAHSVLLAVLYDFNPRSPHGERRRRTLRWSRWIRFQSTLPARGATVDSSEDDFVLEFQSTLPARGATAVSLSSWVVRSPFQSTLPARGATISDSDSSVQG